MSNRTRSNRVSRKLPKNIVKITVEDGREYYTYEMFHFMPEWLEFAGKHQRSQKGACVFRFNFKIRLL